MPKEKKSASPGSSREFQFVTATDLNQFKDKDTMRQVRQTVMHSYLDQAELDPDCTDPRVKKKRVRAPGKHKRPAASISGTVTTSSRPLGGSHSSVLIRPVSSAPAVESGVQTTSANTSSDDQILFDLEHFESHAPSSVSSGASLRQNVTPFTMATTSSHAELVTTSPSNLGVSSAGSMISSAEMDSLFYQSEHNVLVPKSSKSRDQIQFDVAFGNAYGFHLGSNPVDPFATMKPLDNKYIDVELLKSNCATVFGSKAMLEAWVPLLCQTPAAFLSSLCLSAPYTDLMANTNSWDSLNPRTESRQTMEVLDVVPRMIYQSLADPKEGNSDTNVAAVLQLLAANMLGDYTWMIPGHRNYLKHMVSARGGLQRLGNEGVIAATICQTELEASVLYNEDCDTTYLDHARDYVERRPFTKLPGPESPLFCRESDGSLRSVRSDQYCGNTTLGLLSMMHKITDTCIKLSQEEQRARTYYGLQSSGANTTAIQAYRESISGMALDVHNYFSAKQPGHSGFNDPYYEAVRLVSLLYTHAIMHQVPFHRATRVKCRVNLNKQPACHATPALIYEQLTKTNISETWLRMGGVLYWILMVASAASYEPQEVPVASPVMRRDSAQLSKSTPTSTVPYQGGVLQRSDSAPNMPATTGRWSSQPDNTMSAFDVDINEWDSQDWSALFSPVQSENHNHENTPARTQEPMIGPDQMLYINQTRQRVQQYLNTSHHTPFTSGTASLTGSANHTSSPPLIAPMPPLRPNPQQSQSFRPQPPPRTSAPSFIVPSQPISYPPTSHYHTPPQSIPSTSPVRQFKRPRTSTAASTSAIPTTSSAHSAPSAASTNSNPPPQPTTRDEKAAAFRKKYFLANAVRTSILLRFEHTTAMLNSILKLGEVTDYLNRRATPARNSKERTQLA
ncbi:hypothetical protein KVT40_006155 [Elsinoe batatas]|uniref:Transcription factor domain-containing protein n=1 Tax=Elsinoe batatas TaxID=2601811 RepID=A0A8K0PHM4_9PEZI|nr:hypothetical protein KVT40_006155 [Elsinoe batatas]